MAAKKSKKIVKKEEPKETQEEEVIEVKTTKKEAFQDKETSTTQVNKEVEEQGEGEEADTKKGEVTSFSQLDAEKTEETPVEEVKEGVEEKAVEQIQEASKEEVSSDEAKKWLTGVEQEIDVEGKGGFSFKKLLVILLVIAVLGLIAGGFFYYRSKVTAKKEGEALATPSPTTSTPTPTPDEVLEDKEVDLSEYSISVLNGSGIPGEAGVVQKLLEDKGFEKIETGNADSYDYQKTEVSLKKDTPDAVFKSIEESLKDTYSVVALETPLTEDSTFDIIIIVGKKK